MTSFSVPFWPAVAVAVFVIAALCAAAVWLFRCATCLDALDVEQGFGYAETRHGSGDALTRAAGMGGFDLDAEDEATLCGHDDLAENVNHDNSVIHFPGAGHFHRKGV